MARQLDFARIKQEIVRTQNYPEGAEKEITIVRMWWPRRGYNVYYGGDTIGTLTATGTFYPATP